MRKNLINKDHGNVQNSNHEKVLPLKNGLPLVFYQAHQKLKLEKSIKLIEVSDNNPNIFILVGRTLFAELYTLT